MGILNKLFSVRYTHSRRIYNIFGITIKIKDKTRYLEYCIEQLKDFIDYSCDITKCRQATGDLKYIQEVRTKAMKKFSELFKKYNLTFWLDYGTLLGAYRHKGFIPWDDDIDLATDRENYEKMQEILPKILEGTNFECTYGMYKGSYLLKLRHKTGNSYLHVFDMWPYDISDNNNITMDELNQKILNVHKKFYKKYPARELRKHKYTIFETYKYMFELYKKESITGNDREIKYLFKGIDAATSNTIPSTHLYSNVFPLQEIVFDDSTYKAPCNIIEYLDECDDGAYGDIMKFPPLSATRPLLNGNILNEEARTMFKNLEHDLDKLEF